MPHLRRRHRAFRGRHPALRWRLQRLALRARGERDAFEVPHSHFWCDTDDGVRLAGSILGEGPTAIVLAHGFMGYRTKPPWRVLAQRLSRRFTVLAFDLRGHGQSGGECTGGEREPLDVHAVVGVARARGLDRVVTVGGSLGGIAVLGEAAAFRDVDAVVAISTPARWGASDTKAVRRATWLFTSPVGRTLARRVMGTRIRLDWGNPQPPVEVVGTIAPIPLLIVHGADDHYFSPDEARLLHERAGEPKRLLVLDGFGHSEDGFTHAFADRLALEIEALLAARPS